MDYELLVRIAGGMLLLVGGWVLYRAGIRFIGFLLGFFFGVLFGFTFLRFLELMGFAPGLVEYREIIAIALGVIVGVINFWLIVKLYYLVVAATFGVMGWAYHAGVLAPAPFDGGLPAGLGAQIGEPWVTLLFVLVFAVVGVLLHKYLVILLTAAGGAALVVSAFPPEERIPALTPILAAIGILVQFLVSRKMGVHPRSLRKAEEKQGDGKGGGRGKG
jgi:hypothetical protein